MGQTLSHMIPLTQVKSKVPQWEWVTPLNQMSWPKWEVMISIKWVLLLRMQREFTLDPVTDYLPLNRSKPKFSALLTKIQISLAIKTMKISLFKIQRNKVIHFLELEWILPFNQRFSQNQPTVTKQTDLFLRLVKKRDGKVPSLRGPLLKRSAGENWAKRCRTGPYFWWWEMWLLML
jgi:hypothetical protein